VAISGEPNLAFIMETLKMEFSLIQPPDFFTTLRDVDWPEFPDEAIDMVAASESQHSVRLWAPFHGGEGSRQENSSELSPIASITCGWVVKGTSEVQRQMALATADVQHLMQDNPARDRPGYSGPNTWGLFTRKTPGTRIQWEIPKVAQSYGIGIVWSFWDVEYRHPMPMG